MTVRMRTVRMRGVSVAHMKGLTHPLPAFPRAALAKPETVVRLPGVSGATPAAVEDAFRRLTVILAIDDSGSTQPPYGTDPRSVRYAASRSVIEWMRRHGGGRCGVLHWGSTAPARLAAGPVPVSRRMRTLRQALDQRPNLGLTVPAAALRRAARMLPKAAPGDVHAVLLITDGEDPGEGLEEALAGLPEHVVHLMLVGDGARHVGWEAPGVASITRLPAFDNQALTWQAGSVLAGALGLQLRPLSASC
ncbi:hypothetical protein [Streptomyces sp. NPDC058307]|uniref:hypothetical protein n=1 Tax=Streptomyces sp. NPDC058307 TaxID=3346439 RepID=UPI0036E26842